MDFKIGMITVLSEHKLVILIHVIENQTEQTKNTNIMINPKFCISELGYMYHRKLMEYTSKAYSHNHRDNDLTVLMGH